MLIEAPDVTVTPLLPRSAYTSNRSIGNVFGPSLHLGIQHLNNQDRVCLHLTSSSSSETPPPPPYSSRVAYTLCSQSCWFDFEEVMIVDTSATSHIDWNFPPSFLMRTLPVDAVADTCQGSIKIGKKGSVAVLWWQYKWKHVRWHFQHITERKIALFFLVVIIWILKILFLPCFLYQRSLIIHKYPLAPRLTYPKMWVLCEL